MNGNFSIHSMGWLCICLEILLLIIWARNAFGQTDAAGRGLAQVYLLVLAVYICAGIVLMLIQNVRCTIAVLLMTAVPLTVVIMGLINRLSTRRNY